MFTGIVETTGTVLSLEKSQRDSRLLIDASGLGMKNLAIGDSVSVSGVCLTVVSMDNGTLGFDVSAETELRTVIGEYAAGRRVNLETAATPETALGGHLVSGHVDAMAKLVFRQEEGHSVRMVFETEEELAPMIAEKGSICIDGVSLTITHVQDGNAAVEFGVNIVPHTETVTTLSDLAMGDPAHIEVDLIARYLWRMHWFQRDITE